MTAKHVAELMTANPLFVRRDQTLKDAHDLMRTKNIRHIPVLDEQDKLVGVLTQKKMIATVMGLLAKYGTSALERKEKQQIIGELMDTDFATVQPQQSLAEVISYFLKNKHGCLPVVDENEQLLGILTSSDFVRLAGQLLES
ncbi:MULTISPECIES: CBS domain-containing protein [Alkalimonas]|uniref:CBS domain-containing protein n=1 Tax=Alkalimonas amylolytica TaxID=152573 RepID=A0A1H4EYR4_ALKAM|nr:MULTISPECIES: CBS domain-containing protein [Alkalimonas]MCC5825758.1 CBS domain-containing protein [Alkalimonas sp.]SEA89927.1 CBS domain-containing protein [Alkalimonas amylolytica]